MRVVPFKQSYLNSFLTTTCKPNFSPILVNFQIQSCQKLPQRITKPIHGFPNLLLQPVAPRLVNEIQDHVVSQFILDQRETSRN